MSWLTVSKAFVKFKKMEQDFSLFSTAFIILVCKSVIAWSVDLPPWKPYSCLCRILYLSRNEVYLLCINFSNVLLKMGKIDIGQ